MKRILKRALCGVFVLLFMFANANVALAADVFEIKPKFVSPTLYASSEEVALAAALPFDEEKFQAYLLEQLKILPADEECIVEIDISQFKIPYTDENYQAVFNLIWYESPELFRAGSLGVSGFGTLETLYVVCASDFCDPHYFAECSDLMESVVADLVKGVKGNNNLSDVEKALILHDRLAAYCEYDYDRLNNGTMPNVSYTAYGILGLGTGVCMGYALAYDYLLEQVGIKSDYCSSSPEKLNHAWNIVYINNKPYHVDVTWDDPTRDVSGRVLHDNFLRSTEGIIATGHNADDFTTTPTDTTYDDYFWQDSGTAFQLIDNTIYYVDNCLRDETPGTKVGKLIALDGIKDTTPEVLKEFEYTWYFDKEAGSYWSGNHTRLGSIRDLLYYSTPESVCSYNPATGETKELITADDIAENYGDTNLSIFGFTTYKCFYFGEYSNTPGYSATTKEKYFTGVNHNPTENWKVVIEPTYSSEGKEKNYCIDCGAEVGSRLVPALEDRHVWSEWYVDPNNKPTCTEKGVELRDCPHCNAQEWRYGTALGHNYSSSFTVDWEATCKDKGRKSRHCTRCSSVTDVTEIPVTNEHIKGDAWIKGKASTCKDEGYNYKACKICGIELEREVLATTGHSLTLVGAKAATCTEKGYTGDLVCTVCGKTTKGTETPAKGHSSSEWIIDKHPTSTETGSKHKECTVCKTVLETAVIDKNIVLSTPTATTKNTSSGISVSWNSVENAEKYIVYQRVYNEKTKKYSGWKAVKTTTDLTYTDTTVKLGTIYSYTVKAVIGSVQSKFTATKGLRYNVTPTVKTAMASNGIKVTWSTAANATGYTVYSSSYNTKTKKWSGWTNRGTTKNTGWTDTKVKSGTQYRYTVRAKYNTYSGAYNKNGTKLLFLAQPTVKIANNASGVKVSWNKITGATGYTIYRSELSNGAWTSWKNMGTIKKNSTVSWVDKSASSGKTYRYTVRAVNGSTMSTYKASNSVIYLAQPKVSFANAAGGMKVSWGAVPGATGYKVYSSTYNASTKKWSSWTARGTVTATSWTDTNAKSGTYYKYTVKAINGSYTSTFMATSGLIRLAQPTVKVAADANGVKVTWNKIAGAKNYVVYRAELKNGEWSAWSNKGTLANTVFAWVDKSTVKGATYRYTVRAINNKAGSSYAASNSVVPTVTTVATITSSNAKAQFTPILAQYYSLTEGRHDAYLADYTNYKSLLSESWYQQNDPYRGTSHLYKFKTVKSETELRNSYKKYISASLVDNMPMGTLVSLNGNFYLAYNNAVGMGTYDVNSIKFKGEANGGYLVSADYYNSGGVYCQTDVFLVKTVNGKLILDSLYDTVYDHDYDYVSPSYSSILGYCK